MPQQHQRPIAKWNSGRDCWETDQVDLLSGLSDVYSETFTISGSMRNGVAYEHQMSGRLMGGSGSLFSQLGGKLLPSPVAQPPGNSPDDHLRKKPGREVVTDPAIIVENGLLESGGKLLKTPTAQLAINGGSQHPDKRKAGGHGPTLADEVEHLLPTPRATRGGSNTEIAYGFGGERSDDYREQGSVVLPEGARWGPYTAAIARWEAVLGRPAPDPTVLGPKGGRRLSAAFVEWMMGLPEGLVTDPALGLSRTQQLKMLGNGVVTQQAVSALASST